MFGYVPDWEVWFKVLAALGSVSAIVGLGLSIRNNQISKRSLALAERNAEIQEKEHQSSAAAVTVTSRYGCFARSL